MVGGEYYLVSPQALGLDLSLEFLVKAELELMVVVEVFLDNSYLAFFADTLLFHRKLEPEGRKLKLARLVNMVQVLELGLVQVVYLLPVVFLDKVL